MERASRGSARVLAVAATERPAADVTHAGN
jgi:hypothetical protein